MGSARPRPIGGGEVQGVMASIAHEITRLTAIKLTNLPRETLHQKLLGVIQDRSIICCICEYDHDDGATVQCESCQTWQHISCYYFLHAVPIRHCCGDCRPHYIIARHIDVAAAKERQRNTNVVNSKKPLQNFSIIRCVCGSNIDDGDILFCGGCSGWQHVRCYPDVKNMEEHRCMDCSKKDEVSDTETEHGVKETLPQDDH
jgi:hypothetical protein